MRTLGLIAAACAGVGFLLYSERGRQWRSQAGQFARGQYDRVNEALARRRSEKLVEQALDQPHPDTAMADAFEEAVAPAAG